MAGSGLDPALIGNYYKQIQCISLSLSLQPTPALIVPDTAAAHHGNGALDQIPTARAGTRRMVITVMIHGSNGVGGATARAQWEILTFGPQWSGGLVHGPLYLVLVCTGGGCEAI